MKSFTCRCGQALFFDNTRCMNCGSAVGFDPVTRRMVMLDEGLHRACANGSRYRVCNWTVPVDSDAERCRSCRITQVTPNLSRQENIKRWRVLEQAKRRLLYTLLGMRLPIDADAGRGYPALAFEFLEDRGSNPLVAEEYVRTGHATGVITINVSEADDVQREITRSLMNESYRTPLGHCRHESGHYFYDRLIQGSSLVDDFVALFGDASTDYEAALAAYYSETPPADPQAGYISVYARAHPLEDWAECWAHYLHISDTLETAASNGIAQITQPEIDFEQWIRDWLTLSVTLNELNRSMGLDDAYPFILSDAVIDKLRFIHSVVGHQSGD